MNTTLIHKDKNTEFYGKLEDKPETEQILFHLQDELFERRDKYKEKLKAWQAKREIAFKKNKKFDEPPPLDESRETWGKMFKILFEYIQSCVKQRLKNKKFIEPSEIEDKAATITCAFMQQYSYRPDFKVGASFAGMFKWKIVEVLYSKSNIEEDHCISLNALIGDSKTQIQDTGNMSNFMYNGKDSWDPNSSFTEKTANDVIDEILEELDEVIGGDSLLAFKARLYLLIFLKKPKTRHIKRMFKERWAEDHKTEQVIEAAILELYRRRDKYAAA